MRLKLGLPKGRRLGMRAKLMVGLLVAMFPAFLLVVSGDLRRFADRRDAAWQESHAIAEAASALLQEQIEHAATLSRLVLAAGRSSGSVAAAPAIHLEEIRQAYPECLEVFLLGQDGQVLASAPAEPLPLIHPDALHRTTSTNLPVVSDVFLSGLDDRPVIQVLVPLRSGEQHAGAAGVTLDLRFWGSQLSRLTRKGTYDVAVYDRQGWVVHSTSDPELPWPQRDWADYAPVRKALQGEAVEIRDDYSAPNGHTYLGAAVAVPQHGWAITVWQHARESLGDPSNQMTRDLAVLAALTLAAIVAAVWIGSWFSSPVTRLAQHARGLGRGQLNERIELRTGDELEELAEALNNMARQIEERDRKLRNRTAELEAIITQSADGIAIHGPRGELQRLNPAGIRILGRSPGLGLSPAEQIEWFKIRTVSDTPIDPGDLPVAAALRGETRVAEELHIETEAGQERFVAFSASPLTDARGHVYGAVSIFRDMTHFHQAQQEKDDFVSVISHELKTPITSIKGYAQMLLRRAEERLADEKELKGLRIINDEVDRMVDLINQLLDVSRIEARRLELNLERVDLVALAADAVDRLQMTTTRHTLRLRAPQGPLWVQGDAMRLNQVFGNLIMNAIKYSPAGGPIEISLENQEGRAWVSVRDWGIGIAPEDQPHLFQRFYRGKRKSSSSLTGMGLGLYISRQIVERHGGDIVFYSQPGQGTTFLFWLLLSDGSQPPSA